MTDRYAIQVFERYYVPGPWAVLSYVPMDPCPRSRAAWDLPFRTSA